jgi:uncharacterized protein (DUF927 family)
VYENYLKRKQIEWKETTKEKKKKNKTKKGYLVPVGYTTRTGGGRPRARPVTPLVPVGIRNRD